MKDGLDLLRMKNILWIAAVALLPALTRAQPGAPPLVTLEEALRSASAGNESFLIADEELKQAQLIRDKAWAALLPSLTATGNFTHNSQEVSMTGRVIQRQDYLSGNASAKLTLFRGPAIMEIYRACYLSQAAEATTRWSKNDLLFEVARAYYAALATRNLAEAIEKSLKTAQENLATVQARRQAGAALGVDESRARFQVVSTQGDLTGARNAMDAAIEYLAFLIRRNLPIAVERPVDPKIPGQPGPEPEEQAFRLRLDLRAASLNLTAAETAVTESWMDWLPTLSLIGNMSATENTGFSGDPYGWNVMLSMDWMLFDGGLRIATMKERDSLLAESRLKRELLERTVRQELTQARRELATANVMLATAREKLKLAQETHEMVKGRYEAGLATSLELVQAEDSLSQSQSALVSEELNLSLKQLDLLRVMGMDPLGRESTNP